jgi:MFS family permease
MTHTPRPVAVLLNVAHALDHLFLLVFATAVTTIAAEFGFARWEDLMPYSVGAFVLFGLGALPAGRLGDLWGRRQMMLVFFFGMGASALLAAQNAWQMAAALTLLGAFAAIYHPVGIPMLVQHAKNPGATIGVNGLSGNLGIAAGGSSSWGVTRANSRPQPMAASPGTTNAARQPCHCTRKPVMMAAAAMPRLPDSPFTPMVAPGFLACCTSIGMPTGW